jgi:prepilin peptidase CpaA
MLFALLAAVLLTAVAFDVRYRRIPDWLTYPAMVVFLGARTYENGIGDFEIGLVSGAIGFALGLGWFGAFAFFKKGLGWGDVKLAGATGAALGWPLMMTGIACISLVGAAQAVVSMLWNDKADKKRDGIPYAVAIALGTAWAIWWQR